MGVRVKLTNYDDTVLVDAGHMAAPRIAEIDGIIDTGAVRSVIPRSVSEELGLHTRPSFAARPTDGAEVARGITFEIMGREAVGSAVIAGDQVRVGLSVLGELDLVVDTTGRHLVTNPSHPDGPILPLRSPRPLLP